jgi:hypothetical protein
MCVFRFLEVYEEEFVFRLLLDIAYVEAVMPPRPSDT